jgi:hypothetical protein
VLRDHDHRVNACVIRLERCVGREASRHEDHRCVRAGIFHGFPDGVEDRRALVVGAAFARRYAGYEVGAVFLVSAGVEGAFAAGQPLHHQLGVLVDDDRH